MVVSLVYTPVLGQDPDPDDQTSVTDSAPTPPSKADLDKSPVIAKVRLLSDKVPLMIRGESQNESLQTQLKQMEDVSPVKHFTVSWMPWFLSWEKYYAVPAPQAFLDVDSVQIAFEGGLITDIVVAGELKETGSGLSPIARFRNTQLISVSTPMDIELVNTPGNYILVDSPKGDYALDLSDVIDYERHVIAGSASYEPKDDRIVLKAKKHGDQERRTVTLRKKSVLDNLDIKLFTDLAGLSAENPNGLIQIESEYRVQWNTSVSARTAGGKYNHMFFREAKAYVYFSKLEEQTIEIPIDTTAGGLYASSLDFFLYSTVSAGLTANAFSILTSDWLFYVDFGLGVMQTVKTDSTNTENKLRAKYWDFIVVVKRLEGRRIDYELQWWSQYLWSNNEGIVFYDGKRVKHISVRFNFHPNPEDKYKSLFFRYTYSFTDRRNDAFSLQVGYATPISRLFGVN
jgi:hypothetical protein